MESDSELDKIIPDIAHNVMVQLALRKRLKEFRDQGKDAVTKELWQVHMQNAFSPRKLELLTSQQRMKALESLLFLTEK